MPRPIHEFKTEYRIIKMVKTKKENRRCKICNNILSIYNLENECFHHKLNKDRDPETGMTHPPEGFCTGPAKGWFCRPVAHRQGSLFSGYFCAQTEYEIWACR